MADKILHAVYDDDDKLMDAVKDLKASNFYIDEVYTPFPVHGLDKALGLKPTRLAILSFIPYYQNQPIELPRARSGSWGLSSYWRILIDVLSGRSVKSKINNIGDYELLNQYFSKFELFINFNFVLILIILLFSFFHIIRNFYKKQINDFDILFIGSLVVSGIVFTILDIPLYAHYLLMSSIFVFISLFSFIKHKAIFILLISVLMVSNIYINYSFYEFIEINNGAQNSDYGKPYKDCGCCVEDARVCRGQ